jgi:hypothetical protein
MPLEAGPTKSKFHALERVMLTEATGFCFVEVKDEEEAKATMEWIVDNGGVKIIERDRALAQREKSFGVLTAARQILSRRTDARDSIQRLFPEIIPDEIDRAEALSTQPMVAVAPYSNELTVFLDIHRNQLSSQDLFVFIVTVGSSANLRVPTDFRTVMGAPIKIW